MKKIKYLAIFILMITNIVILSNKVDATTGRINAETVRVRNEATTKSTILTQLDKGEEVEILEESEGWYKVTVTKKGEKITGYISASLLDVEKQQEAISTEKTEQPKENENKPEENNQEPQVQEPSIETNATIEENIEYPITQEIKLRVLPVINSREKATISTGNAKIIEIINDWCKIENEIVSGWIRINTLKKSINNNNVEIQQENENKPGETTVETNEPTTKPEENTTVIKTGYVSTESLKVRKEANTSSEVIDSLKKNDKVSIIEELDGWYKIKFSNKLGYISSKYISDKKVAETTSRGGNTSRPEQTTQIEQQSEQTVQQEQPAQPETTPETNSATGEAIVEYAKQYLGYKYVSGGTSPSKGFDCSGFTQYVYKHFGITINRVSRDQNKNGVAVAKSDLQVGDLLIFNGESNKSIGHVGIYIGNGNFIHASNPKGGVKIDSISSSYYSVRYVGARRVI